jgi:ubiquinone/menaquinone biosynthesis C-methylase UbiE
MDDKDSAYYRYLLTSEVSPGLAERHREMVADYFWAIFNRYNCRKVLDVGCGLGSFIGKCPGIAEAIGVDANRKAVEHCRLRGLAVREGTAEQLPVDSNDLDGIMCAHLMEHIEEPEHVFLEFARVLRPGGVLIVRVPPFDASFYDDWTHVRPYTKKTLIRLSASTGFEVEKVSYYCYGLPFPYWRNPLFLALNGIRRLPVVSSAVNAVIRSFGFPPRELVLVARKKQP